MFAVVVGACVCMSVGGVERRGGDRENVAAGLLCAG
jgi:hypothetical protein